LRYYEEQDWKTSDFGVFLDWCSLFQRDRDAIMELAFTRSLNSMSIWYGHRCTHKWLLTALPTCTDGNMLPYTERGWTTFEAAVATMFTPSSKIVDCSRLPPLVDLNRDPTLWEDVTKTSSGSSCPRKCRDSDFKSRRRAFILRIPCRMRALPVRIPAKFTEELDTKIFTRGQTDHDLVASLYGSLFHDMSHSSTLDYAEVPLDLDLVIELFEILKSFVHLKQLALARCSLRILPESIGLLLRIEALDLSGNDQLPVLPESICNLVNLQTINLSGCSGLTVLPDNIGNWSNLAELCMCGCSSLTALPDRIAKLKNLLRINLSGCTTLTGLPMHIGNLKKVQEMNLSDCCNLKKLPEGIGGLGRWNRLIIVLSGCCKLGAVPESISRRNQEEASKMMLTAQMMASVVGKFEVDEVSSKFAIIHR